MKSLKEALLNRPKNIDVTEIAAKEYINNNYDISGNLTYENVNGVCIVNCDGDVEVKNKEIGKLTEGFVWGEVKGNFNCPRCKNLRTLEGAPEKVGRYFHCSGCYGLKSLEGAPKETKYFYCTNCKNLRTLKGAPEVVGGGFYCRFCTKLKSLEGAPKKIGGEIDCDGRLKINKK